MTSEPTRLTPTRIWAGHLTIGPRAEMPLAGYAGRTAPAPAAPDALEANWVAWPTGPGGVGLFVALDTLFSSQAFEAALDAAMAAAGHPLTSLTVVASHTHFAPSLDPGKPGLGPCQGAYLDQVSDAIANTVAGTMAEGPPREINQAWFGAAPAPGSIFRRRRGLTLQTRAPFLGVTTQMAPNPGVSIPRLCRIWGFGGNGDGPPDFVLASWPCHPVSRHRLDQVSADYIAALRDAIREHVRAPVPVLFLPGVSGDIRPDARASLVSRRGLFPYPLQSSFGPASPAFQRAFNDGITQAARTALGAARPIAPGSDITVATGGVPLDCIAPGAGDGDMPVTAVRFLGVTVLGLGAEPSARWLDALGWTDSDQTQILTGYTGPAFGYLPTRAQVKEGGYEVTGFGPAFGFSGRFDQDLDLDTMVLEAMRGTLEEVWTA
ncbi:MAG: hypothetical protein AAGB15_00020 [Pseudomonadota bacterium]